MAGQCKFRPARCLGEVRVVASQIKVPKLVETRPSALCTAQRRGDRGGRTGLAGDEDSTEVEVEEEEERREAERARLNALCSPGLSSAPGASRRSREAPPPRSHRPRPDLLAPAHAARTATARATRTIPFMRSRARRVEARRVVDGPHTTPPSTALAAGSSPSSLCSGPGRCCPTLLARSLSPLHARGRRGALNASSKRQQNSSELREPRSAHQGRLPRSEREQSASSEGEQGRRFLVRSVLQLPPSRSQPSPVRLRARAPASPSSRRGGAMSIRYTCDPARPGRWSRSPAREVAKPARALALLLLGLAARLGRRALLRPAAAGRASQVHADSSAGERTRPDGAGARALASRRRGCCRRRRLLLVEVLAKPRRPVGLALHARALAPLLLGHVGRRRREPIGEPRLVRLVRVLEAVGGGRRKKGMSASRCDSLSGGG